MFSLTIAIHVRGGSGVTCNNRRHKLSSPKFLVAVCIVTVTQPSKQCQGKVELSEKQKSRIM